MNTSIKRSSATYAENAIFSFIYKQQVTLTDRKNTHFVADEPEDDDEVEVEDDEEEEDEDCDTDESLNVGEE